VGLEGRLRLPPLEQDHGSLRALFLVDAALGAAGLRQDRALDGPQDLEHLAVGSNAAGF